MLATLLPMPPVSRHREPRRYVAFDKVPPSQYRIHDRLENWARWSHGSSGGEQARNSDGSPMFRLYRADNFDREYGKETSIPVDKDDALKIHFAIVHPTFDPKCRRALQWCYLRPRDPKHKAWELGTTLDGLARLVSRGRELLMERGI